MTTTMSTPPTTAASAQSGAAAWRAHLWRLGETCLAGIEQLRPLAQIAARQYVAGVFFQSGLTKLHDWGTTLALFHNEYHVPLLNATAAAYLGTGGELGLSVLLAAGLFGRVAATGLSILNVVAALSLTDIAPAALQGHLFWGSLLAGLLLWGPGAWSVDRVMVPRLRGWALHGRRARATERRAARARSGRGGRSARWHAAVVWTSPCGRPGRSAASLPPPWPMLNLVPVIRPSEAAPGAPRRVIFRAN